MKLLTNPVYFIVFVFLLSINPIATADETCMSPYMAKIVGQEDFVYVWTLGMEGLGDEQDKLVTVDVNPQSENYGKVINSLSVGGRNEAHHSGLTDDRRYLWASGLDTNKIFIIDIHTDPAKPRLYKTISNFVAQSGGVVGPHTSYAMPGRMLITGLSNDKDHGGTHRDGGVHQRWRIHCDLLDADRCRPAGCGQGRRFRRRLWL